MAGSSDGPADLRCRAPRGLRPQVRSHVLCTCPQPTGGGLTIRRTASTEFPTSNTSSVTFKARSPANSFCIGSPSSPSFTLTSHTCKRTQTHMSQSPHLATPHDTSQLPRYPWGSGAHHRPMLIGFTCLQGRAGSSGALTLCIKWRTGSRKTLYVSTQCSSSRIHCCCSRHVRCIQFVFKMKSLPV